MLACDARVKKYFKSFIHSTEPLELEIKLEMEIKLKLLGNKRQCHNHSNIKVLSELVQNLGAKESSNKLIGFHATINYLVVRKTV